jgi:hypothetical protein
MHKDKHYSKKGFTEQAKKKKEIYLYADTTRTLTLCPLANLIKLLCKNLSFCPISQPA